MPITPIVVDNINLQKSVRNYIMDYLKSDEVLEGINNVLMNYTSYPKGAPKITANNIITKRVNRNIRNFPAISVVSLSRGTEWIASRTTQEEVSLRIFCCILADNENSMVESVMEDLTDTITAVLYRKTKFAWSVPDPTDPEDESKFTNYSVFDAKPTSITYGSIDSGFIRAGQIDWRGRILLAQNDSY